MQKNYAHILDDGTVNIIVVEDYNVERISNEIHLVDIEDLEVKPQSGWTYDGESFTSPPEPEDPNTYVHITTDKTEITADNSDTATISLVLKNSVDEVVDITGRKYMDIEGHGVVGVDFTNGEATVLFKTSVSKKYIIDNCFEGYIEKDKITIWALL